MFDRAGTVQPQDRDTVQIILRSTATDSRDVKILEGKHKKCTHFVVNWIIETNINEISV